MARAPIDFRPLDGPNPSGSGLGCGTLTIVVALIGFALFIGVRIFQPSRIDQLEKHVTSPPSPSPASEAPVRPAGPFTVASTSGWQRIPVSVREGQQVSISARGSWTVDYRNFSRVGPEGYSWAEDSRIYQGCKLTSELPYAVLLARVEGSPSFWAVGPGGKHLATRSGALELRIHDQDHCLVDNAGSMEVIVTVEKPFIGTQVPQPRHIRGTIIAVTDHELTIGTNDGNREMIKLAQNVGLFLMRPTGFTAIQPGEFVGTISVAGKGNRIALEVHIFAEYLRGLGEGHYGWDLPGPTMMTNARVTQIIQEAGNAHTLRLSYNGGEQTIEVSSDTTVFAFERADAGQLVPGRKVFMVMSKNQDIPQVAAVVIGARGVKPPI